MKILIVDDHEGVRRMIRYLLVRSVDTARECESGEEAVRLAADFRPDCVTMDIGMPGLSAFDAIRGTLAACPGARIIVVTSFDTADLRLAAFDAGARGYVVKDDLSKLPDVVSAVLAETT